MSDDGKKTDRLPMLSLDDAPRSQRPSMTSLVDWEEEEATTRTTDSSIAVVPPVSPQTSKTSAVLTVVSGPSTGRVFSVSDRRETVIGRGKEADIRIDDAGVSRAHARVVTGEGGQGRTIVEDLGSTNGTFVDGKRVDRSELRTGQRIHLGPNVVVSFSVVDAQVERVTQQLYESSVRDPLTRAHNRRYLVDRLAGETAYALRHESRLGLLLLDLDHFKRVNDTYGHLAGDDVLRDVSALLQRKIRTEDVLARFGGEEFVVLVRGIEHPNVGRFAERLRAGIERLEIASGGDVIRVTVSIGIASMSELPSGQQDAEALMRLADERLYKAKTSGRNRVCGA
jgi:diguanylate cyclase (GGDEF)-like protein